MPLKLKVQLGADTFEAEGDFQFADVIDALRTWVNAIDDTPAAIDQVADDLSANTDRLAAAVAQHTPPPEPSV